jgi:aryl-alcohol dehydrogenase-like predicted oxidoreductase
MNTLATTLEWFTAVKTGKQRAMYNSFLSQRKDPLVTLETITPLRRLGETDIKISPIGLGTMEFSGGGGLMGLAFPTISQEDKNAIVLAALEGGINWFDTAEMYGRGISETSLAAALKAAGKRDDEVVIATKWFPGLRTASNIPHSVQNRLHFLDGYSIGLYMVHQPWSFSSPEAEMDAMADLVEAGKIRSVGVSNFNAERMRRAHKQLESRGLPLAANEMEFSLLDRSIETDGVLETAKELGVTIIAYTPLASGLLTGKYHKNPELLQRKMFYFRRKIQGKLEASRPLVQALEEIGSRYNATPAQIALNWVIHFHGETIVTIPGATRVHQAEESAGAQKFVLTAEEMAQLDELSRGYK